ncbi:MAG: hypothetical protein ABUR63_05515 [Verrucomicrobiota bacterium]
MEPPSFPAVASAVIACGSELGFVPGAGPEALVRLAGDAGFNGIALGAGCGLRDVAPLIGASLAAGLVVSAVAAPLSADPLPAGRRLPYLAAMEDSDERRAAVAAFKATLEAAGTFGVRLLSVSLGAVSLGVSAQRVARRFARRELDDDDPGAASWRAAVGERRALSGMVVDACRHALDRILPDAERRDAVIALEVAGDPWGLPGPREAMILIDEYRNGPIAAVWDEARMQVLTTLGIGMSAERAAALAQVTKLWRANEAVGTEIGYLPGLGDPGAARADTAVIARPQDAPIVITGRQDSRPREIALARALVAGRA